MVGVGREGGLRVDTGGGAGDNWRRWVIRRVWSRVRRGSEAAKRARILYDANRRGFVVWRGEIFGGIDYGRTRGNGILQRV